jgi:hypothetical protein
MDAANTRARWRRHRLAAKHRLDQAAGCLQEEKVIEKPIPLADAGIDKNLANRARKAAALSPEQFEERGRDSPARQTGRRAVRQRPAGGRISGLPARSTGCNLVCSDHG